MLDIRWLGEHPAEWEAGAKKRGLPTELLQRLLEKDQMLRTLRRKIAQLREKQRALQRTVYASADKEGAIERLKQLGQELSLLEKEEKEGSEQLDQEVLALPNLPDDTLPEKDQVVGAFGKRPSFPYPPKRAKELMRDLALTAGKGETGVIWQGAGAVLLSAASLYLQQYLWEKSAISPLSPGIDAALPSFLKGGMLQEGEQRGYSSFSPSTGDLTFSCIGTSGNLSSTETSLRGAVEGALQALGIAGQVLRLGYTSLPAESRNTLVLEAWVPSKCGYRAVCTLSETGKYLTRQAHLRCQMEEKTGYASAFVGKIQVDILLKVILEGGQQGNGSVALPECLRPMAGIEEIRQCYM